MRSIVERRLDDWRARSQTLRAMRAEQYALRAVLLIGGAAALVVAAGGWELPEAIFVVIGAFALVWAVINPGSELPMIFVGSAAAVWLIRYGLDELPPAGPTVALAVLFYLHHTTAALCAMLPMTARVERAVLLRWYGQAAFVVAVAGGFVAAVYGIGRPGGGVWLDLVGMAGAVIVAMAVVVQVVASQRPNR